MSFAETAQPAPVGVLATRGPDITPGEDTNPPRVSYDRARTQVSVVDKEAGSLLVDVPGSDSAAAPGPQVAAKAREVDAGRLLAVTDLESSAVVSYQNDKGFQALISIDGEAAPTSFDFPLDLPAGATLTVEEDGAVSVRDAEGLDIGGFAAPWAFDAENKPVPTSFTVTGNRLTQVVQHGPGTAYPVVADPSGFWGWATCVATVATVLAANSNLALKVAKVVKRFGSLKKTVQIAYKAYKQAPKAKKRQAAINAIGAVAAEFLGIASIKEKCFD